VKKIRKTKAASVAALSTPETPSLSVGDFLKEKSHLLKLRLVAGASGLSRKIQAFEVNRPGLALLGHLEHLRSERVQVIGRGEEGFIAKTPRREIEKNLSKILARGDLPCVVLTWNAKAHPLLTEVCERYHVPLLVSELDTAHFVGELTPYLEDRLAPTQCVHGVLVDVYGLGVLLMGESGIGKSECALELLKRSHILISDDLVRVKRLPGEIIVGESANRDFGHYMELRGLGIVNVRSLFGVGSVMEKSRLELAVTLELMRSVKQSTHYERVGLDERKFSVLGVKLPHVVFPVVPGRNLAILIEVAALNQRLKNQGVHPAEEFEEKLLHKTAQKVTA